MNFVDTICTIIFIIICIFLLMFSFDNGKTEGYKQGQIDAINGKIKYELKVNDDKTSEWIEKK